ncbi:molybdopterin-guanine dinucleotide biosynthesis protein MobC [Dickeya zeae]|uniref:Molybdopterin-guanine dinucleotide biosynthesis protein MobC n=1 Tax=Dickeya zeae TaxID=204042 RepID=A0AAE7CZ40_9GAMM|nr:MobC family replication-relaxation protein [Dickeya zeae]QIZ51606.1 molybdopterin-guanine dinucleotide biosynthesis protein MobC [Dickeya zeae]
MLISTYRERHRRNNEKIKILRNFLKEETYSDFKTLMLLFDFKNHKPLYLLLAKAIKMGWVQKHEFDTRTGKISLWGITSDGLAVVVKPNDDIFPARFEPSRITGWTLEHHLDNQAARLILEKKDATGWINGDRSTFLSRYQVKHRPEDPQKKRALELLFDSIKHVIVNHQPIPLEVRHRNVFRIYTLAELRQLELKRYS